jgi:two-component system, LytTR family, response regulator
MIRVLIVDDEAWARRRIVRLLKGESDVEVVAECVNGAAAIERIEKDAPDLVFLDVQMPELNGFEVIDALDSEHVPLFIFATAYDKYALRAFDAHAYDYLLKPFEEQRFREALNRAREELRRPRESSKAGFTPLLASLRRQPGYLARLAVKTAGRMIFLKASDIDWVEASGNYVSLHVGRNTHLLRTTITDFVARLDAGQFVRIHRSTVVNLDRIQEVMPWSHGEQVARLKDGTELAVGRAFRHGLIAFLANPIE